MNKIILLIGLLGFSFSISADDTDAIRQAIKSVLKGQKVDSINKTPLPNIYEVLIGTQVMYVSKDGKYLIEGDVYDLSKMKNLTEDRRAEGRFDVLNRIDEKGMIVFHPNKVKYKLTVFTDIDCGYCRKLHSEMNSYLEKGIEIRYMAYPRSGIDSKSYVKAVNVWCSADRNAAMTKAKSGEQLEKKDCDNPVKEHYEAGRKVGVTGTPSLVMENGQIIPGYVPADRLSTILAQKNDK